ncbi:podocalyxin [Sminthopsis crassicaudata]|uniref:podocalyxin n=1 Tax=Sminthopsis crassicaudata TaxID=9301 RepID=UPI003D69C6FD
MCPAVPGRSRGCLGAARKVFLVHGVKRRALRRTQRAPVAGGVSSFCSLFQTGVPAQPAPPPRAAPGGRGGEGAWEGAGRGDVKRRSAAAAPSPALPAPPRTRSVLRLPRLQLRARCAPRPARLCGRRRSGRRRGERGPPSSGGERTRPDQPRTALRGSEPAARLPQHLLPRPRREDRMRSALLLLLLLAPRALGNDESTSRMVTVATTISAGSHQTTGKSQTADSPQPTGPSETKKPTTAAIRPTTLQPTNPALPITQTTPKSSQEGGDLTTLRGEPTTKAPSSVSASSTPLETIKETTVAPTAVSGPLGTQGPALTSQATEPLLSPSATTKLQEDTTLSDASIPQTTSLVASTHKSESPPSLTSQTTPVPGAFPSPVSTETSLTSRTQPPGDTSETPVSKSTVSVSSEHPPASVSSEGPPGSFTSEGPSASVTPEMIPRDTTLVVSENSTSFSTSPYSSHSEPPAMTSEAEIFSPIPNKITCQPDSYTTENLLILKITNFSVCDGVKDSRNHPLYTALCRAGKPSFNKDRDLCHVQLISQPEKQEVAVLNVSVQTHLHPKELYEVLKKRWDDLKALGVSNMTYGKESLDKDVEDRFSMPLIITIVCMAAFLLFVAALYGCFHQRFTQRKDQQRLTEELQTVENGYHDNPTLEVMETSSEMQEKKVANLNGELGDSWIVPLDNLTKDDLDQEEEDTHL